MYKAITKVLPYGKVLCHEPHIYLLKPIVMPNWCENKLIIRANNIVEIYNDLTDDGKLEHFDFSRVIPTPDTDAYNNVFEKSQEEIRDDPTFWYDWNVNNWGTKWNASDSYFTTHHELNTLEIDFMTAWSPAEPIAHALAEKYPNAIIMLGYEEGGMNFKGCLIIVNGRVEEEECIQMIPEVSIESSQWYDLKEEE
jgi:hypothetical protein